MNATIDVTLMTAIWNPPRIFAGSFTLDAQMGGVPVEYRFRAEARENEYRFTALERAEASSAPFLHHPLAVEILAFALEGAVGLLQARELKRFQEGLTQSAEPPSLEDLGFQVRFPFSPQDADTLAAFASLIQPVGEVTTVAEA